MPMEAATVVGRDGVQIPGRPRYIGRDPFNNLIEFTIIEYDYLQ